MNDEVFRRLTTNLTRTKTSITHANAIKDNCQQIALLSSALDTTLQAVQTLFEVAIRQQELIRALQLKVP